MICFVTLKELSGCLVAARFGTGAEKMEAKATDSRTVVDCVCVGGGRGQLGERKH